MGRCPANQRLGRGVTFPLCCRAVNGGWYFYRLMWTCGCPGRQMGTSSSTAGGLLGQTQTRLAPRRVGAALRAVPTLCGKYDILDPFSLTAKVTTVTAMFPDTDSYSVQKLRERVTTSYVSH